MDDLRNDCLVDAVIQVVEEAKFDQMNELQ